MKNINNKTLKICSLKLKLKPLRGLKEMFIVVLLLATLYVNLPYLIESY